MNGRDAQAGPAVYELTVKGGMGPVFRSAVTPLGVTRSGVCTILRAGHAPGRDLVDLLLLVQEKGLTVEDVFAIEP
jgi:hypothetical protein